MATSLPADARADTLVDVLMRRAVETPERTAFIYAADVTGTDSSISCATLARRASMIARQLREAAEPGARALLLYPPGLDYICALYGCLLAGIVAVPAYPARAGYGRERLDGIARDCGATLALHAGDRSPGAVPPEAARDDGAGSKARPAARGRRAAREASQGGLRSLHWIAATGADAAPDSGASGESLRGSPREPARESTSASLGAAPIADARAKPKPSESPREPLYEPRVTMETLALLQYTSGSTGAPKGVMLTHGNLAHNLAQIADRFGYTPETRAVVWLPPYHDMGLIGGILGPLHGGFLGVLMAPSAFLVRPIAWLEAIAAYRGTTSGGPDFAYDLAVRRTTPEQRARLDLRSWRVAVNGAEPVRRDTLERFAEAFACAGFDRSALAPSYGLAEATLMVAGVGAGAPVRFDACDSAELEAHRRKPGSSVTFTGCGAPIGGQTVRIVQGDPPRACEPGELGEIWVSGPSVAQGHWGRARGGEEAFGHRLTGEPDREFLRTGDLGYLHDGELFVTGRASDLIIIRGRNYYPQHVEAAVERAHPALRPSCAAAFTVEEAGSPRLIVAAEMTRASAADPEAVTLAIRRAVAERQNLQVQGVALLRRGTLPKTTSGKVQRHRCRQLFERNALEAIAIWQARRPAGAPLACAAGPAGAAGTATGAGLPAAVSTGVGVTAAGPTDRGATADDGTVAGGTVAGGTVGGATGAGAKPLTADAVRAWLLDAVAELAEYPAAALDTQTPLAYYGLDSAKATELTHALERWSGLTLASTVTWDRPTIDQLADHVAALAAGTPRPARAPVEAGRFEPIAVVGMACRFPGHVNEPDDLWRLLRENGSAVTEVPRDRWDIDALYDPTPGTTAKMYTRWGAFLDDVGAFDPLFFGITPREATNMDPQQRLLMETVWEALEQAGRAPSELAGSATGVYVGISNNDYLKYQLRLDNYLQAIDVTTGTGTAFCIAANRISYALDLRGPSLAVDTACSSALVAVHLACASLQARECDTAIAAGVNVICSPETTIAFSRARMMSPTGQCRPFDGGADGYVRGEGCGVILLKRLADAEREGDEILGVIRGSAVNQDGKTNGLTAPSPRAQTDVIRRAIESAGLTPDAIDYVEAHGTGTSLGDPIEYEGLAAVFGARAPGIAPCLLASLKANLGHLESAAGIAGLIKVLLCLRHGELPAAYNFDRLNPRIAAVPGLEIPTTPRAWTANGRARVAGVSSFGFGGTNAHVVLAEPPPREPAAQTEARDRAAHVLALSARSAEGVAALATRYAEHLEQHPDSSLSDLCHSASVGRAHWRHRAAFVVSDRAELIAALRARAEEGDRDRLAQEASGEAASPAGSAQPPERLAFLFTGQGSQYVGMGRGLYDSHPRFRETLDRCDRIAAPLLGRSLTQVMFVREPDGSSRLDETAFAQPALFALEYALADLWQSWGIVPTAVAGHSIGEYVAACVAGMLDLDAALPLVIERGRLMQSLPAGGGMLAVLSSIVRVREAIRPFEPDIVIAAHNAPNHVVLAGDRARLQALQQQLAAQQVQAQLLQVSHAFHSPLLEPVLDALAASAARVDWRPPAMPIVSNLTGDWFPTDRAPDAAYWARHAREAVRFGDGLDRLIAGDRRTFLEIGPAPALCGFGRRHAEGGQCVWLGSLHPDRRDWMVMLQSVATLYERGAALDWRAFDSPYARTRVRAPGAIFQRERFWTQAPRMPGAAAAAGTDEHAHGDGRADEADEGVSAGASAIAVAAQAENGADGLTASEHPLLGRRLRSAHPRFEARVPVARTPFLADHKVRGATVWPASGYLEMAVAAVRATTDGAAAVALSDVVFPSAWVVKGRDRTQVQTTLLEQGVSGVGFEIHTIEGASARATLRAKGMVTHAVADDDRGSAATLEALRARCTEAVSADDHYAALRARGLEYGPAFQTVRALWRGALEAVALVETVDDDTAARPYALHPALLDGCFQALAAALPATWAAASDEAWVPVGVERLRFLAAAGARVWAHVALRGAPADRGTSVLDADVRLFDPAGTIVADLRGLRLQRLATSVSRAAPVVDLASSLYDLRWNQAPRAPRDERSSSTLGAGIWLIVSDESRTPRDLAARIRGKGRACIVATRGAALELSAQSATLDTDDPSQLNALLDALCANGERLAGIVWFAPDPEEAPGDDVALLASRIVRRWLHGIRAALAQAAREAPRLWLVTRGAQAVRRAIGEPLRVEQAPAWGMARVLALEHPELRCTRIDLGVTLASSDAGLLMTELAEGDDEEVAFREGVRHVPALVRREAAAKATAETQALRLPAGEAYTLDVRRAGDLQSLYYRPHVRPSPGPGQVEIQVQAAALNFSDVMKALGLYPASGPGPLPIGAECAGIVSRVGEGVALTPGTMVTGIAPFALGPKAITDARLVTPVPAGMTAEEAATIPIAFLTADYALHTIGRMQRGERVLIHAGAGGVGLAAIQLAQRAGLDVFATAGTPEKRSFLEYAGVRHVFDSRTLQFEADIRRATAGEGVDLVLNSLAGEAVACSLRLLRPYGRFLEIGKTDIYQRSQLPLGPFRGSLSYAAIDLDRMFRDRADLIQSMLIDLMRRFAAGDLRPLPRRVFAATDAVDGFRYMAQRKNIGKVEVAFASAAVASKTPASAMLRRDATYVVCGGAGALGLELVDWLVARGARHVALVGRSAPARSAEDRLRQHGERDAGIDIRTFRADVSDAEALRDVLSRMRTEMPPLRGIFHAAGCLDDGAIAALDDARLEKVLAPKVAGAWNLHQLTLDDPLEAFVLFSSAAGLLGSPGQANYAAGNAFLDALAWHRRACGKPALAIDWGPFASVGMAAADAPAHRLAAKGMAALPPAEGIALLDDLLGDAEAAQVAVMAVDWARVKAISPGGRVPALARGLLPADAAATVASAAAPLVRELNRDRLAPLAPAARVAALASIVRAELTRLSDIPEARIDLRESLATLGLDSITVLELKNTLEAGLAVTIPTTLLAEGPSIQQLVDFIDAEAFGSPHAGAAASSPTAASASASASAAGAAPTGAGAASREASDHAREGSSASPLAPALSTTNGHANGAAVSLL